MPNFARIGFLTLLLTAQSYAQPDTLWTRLSAIMDVNNTEVVRREDNGFAIGGHYVLSWRNDQQRRQADCFYLVLTDSLGIAEDSIYYVPVPSEDTVSAYMRDIIRCRDGGYLMVGITGAATGQAIRTDPEGNLIWQTYFPGNQWLTSLLSCGLGEGDTLMVAAGNVLAKLDPDGEVVWMRQYWNLVYTSNILLLEDFGYYLTGFTARIGHGSDDIYAARIDRNGELIWENTYGTELSEVCGGTVITSDGGLCIAGTQRFGQGGGDLYPVLVRIDEDGNQVWIHIIDEYGSGEVFSSIVQTLDGGFAAAGDYGNLQYYLVRADEEGNILWRATWGGNVNRCGTILMMDDGGFLLGGYGGYRNVNRGAFLVRTEPDPIPPSYFSLLEPHDGDSTGLGEVNFVWQQSVDLNVNDSVTFALCLRNGEDSLTHYDISDTSIVVSLDTVFADLNAPTELEWWVIAISNEDTVESREHFGLHVFPQGIEDDARLIAIDFSLGPVFPNPFNESVQIRYSLPTVGAMHLAIFDISGREIISLFNGTQAAGFHKTSWQANSVSAGVYFLRLKAGKFVQTQKVVLVR